MIASASGAQLSMLADVSTDAFARSDQQGSELGEAHTRVQVTAAYPNGKVGIRVPDWGKSGTATRISPNPISTATGITRLC